jgi:hypothetical protein
MLYIICVLTGIVIGLLGGLLIIRKKLSADKSGDGGALSPDEIKKLQQVLKLIQEGDNIIEQLNELIEGKDK